MIVAIPIAEGRVSPVLDTAARFLIVRRDRGKVTQRRECVISPLPVDAMARSIAELQVDVVLCAAVSESLRRMLEGRGVRIRRHLCGDAESVLDAFLGGHLRQSEFRMPGCWGWHLDDACRRRPCRERGSRSGTQVKRKVVLA
jgi:predicted Fe-Mo cluster-binding NifX family protein